MVRKLTVSAILTALTFLVLSGNATARLSLFLCPMFQLRLWFWLRSRIPFGYAATVLRLSYPSNLSIVPLPCVWILSGFKAI